MSSRELHELRRALERLRDALEEAVRALDGEDKRVPRENGAYGQHGAPFGGDQRGRLLWDVFRQFTTRN